MGLMGKGKTMKKFTVTVEKQDGELRKVYVFVDGETAKVLEQVDEATRQKYLEEEYKMNMSDIGYHRVTQSLDKSLDNGFDIIDEKQDVEEMAIKQAEKETVLEAISKLEPQQQWLIKELYFYGRTQVDVAKELGISKAAITNRLNKISVKIKKFLK